MSPRNRRCRRRAPRPGLGALTLALFVAVTFAFPGFAAPRNLAGLLDDTAILIMLALGQMLVILVRGIDLSIAANLALCGMLAALFNRAFPEAGVAAGARAHAGVPAPCWARSTACWSGSCACRRSW